MATLASTRLSDIEVFNFLYPKAYPKKKHLKNSLLPLVNDGVLAIETLFERALSIQGRLRRNSVHGEDFEDGSDAKKCIAHVSKTGRRLANGKRSTTLDYRAKVGRFNNKRGTLRVLVHEPVHNTFHFFKIPRSAYRNLKSINIPFNRTNGNLGDSKWNRYTVNSFKELAR